MAADVPNVLCNPQHTGETGPVMMRARSQLYVGIQVRDH